MGLNIDQEAPTVSILNATLPDPIELNSDNLDEEIDPNRNITMQFGLTWSPLTKINKFSDWNKENLAYVVVG